MDVGNVKNQDVGKATERILSIVLAHEPETREKATGILHEPPGGCDVFYGRLKPTKVNKDIPGYMYLSVTVTRRGSGYEGFFTLETLGPVHYSNVFRFYELFPVDQHGNAVVLEEDTIQAVLMRAASALRMAGTTNPLVINAYPFPEYDW